MKYFTISELCASATAAQLGINNKPTQEATDNLVSLVTNILDPLRAAWGDGIRVTSGYRSAVLNKAVGGSSTSAHLHGLAADVVPVNGKILDFKAFCVNWLKANNICFDQYIDEQGGGAEWVHIGIRSPKGVQRLQFLKYRNKKYLPL